MAHRRALPPCSRPQSRGPGIRPASSPRRTTRPRAPDSEHRESTGQPPAGGVFIKHDVTSPARRSDARRGWDSAKGAIREGNLNKLKPRTTNRAEPLARKIKNPIFIEFMQFLKISWIRIIFINKFITNKFIF